MAGRYPCFTSSTWLVQLARGTTSCSTEETGGFTSLFVSALFLIKTACHYIRSAEYGWRERIRPTSAISTQASTSPIYDSVVSLLGSMLNTLCSGIILNCASFLRLWVIAVSCAPLYLIADETLTGTSCHCCALGGVLQGLESDSCDFFLSCWGDIVRAFLFGCIIFVFVSFCDMATVHEFSIFYFFSCLFPGARVGPKLKCWLFPFMFLFVVVGIIIIFITVI